MAGGIRQDLGEKGRLNRRDEAGREHFRQRKERVQRRRGGSAVLLRNVPRTLVTKGEDDARCPLELTYRWFGASKVRGPGI